MKKLHFDILNNASDSLRHAVHLLAWEDATPSNRYKQAILSIFHCSELLLKERLRQVNPALIWENVDKYPSLAARTVTVDKAISRLIAIGGVLIAEADKETLLACRNLRNAIQHFEFEFHEKEAKALIGRVLSFVFAFASKELEADLEEQFKDDDTWTLLVEQLYEFAEQYGPRISELMVEVGGPVGSCTRCGQDTVDLIFERCRLCGCEYERDEDFSD
ncbi:hypothetical protein [Thioalkalivibrio sp. ALgr1]|uniref:hypothetical protein n=1 Tax=Thioalkalivibrio sp. ALgr1 TaxID=748655 RepID=UPI00037AD0EB|nr:hypothetical protein [Thioalkalivibrio sp. ALgr1]